MAAKEKCIMNFIAIGRILKESFNKIMISHSKVYIFVVECL